ncbi:putative transcriptional regulator with HTH domain [Saprospira grandis DSM 2844]|uniref:Putative transcriptional regulator with HTH domain n=1 Tax=Saprospira grandis DSM 2844 TaxID=694433 RepID=J0XWB5_9BACT|nr:winged helix-turn-helix transcriptional regulator [Saprospira grandis]EJF53316.1 putative transcriptional regulator with HTH domain [Saprospira grandis DSM 2844]
MGVIFNFSQNFIRIELPKKQLPASQKGLVKGVVKDLDERQIALLNLIAENPKYTKVEMAQKIGVSTTTIDKHLKVLKELKLLKRQGGRKNGYWQILHKNDRGE